MGKIFDIIIKLFLTIAVTIILSNGNPVYAYDVVDPNQPSCGGLLLNGQSTYIVRKGDSFDALIRNILWATRVRVGMTPQSSPACITRPVAVFSSGSADNTPDSVDYGCLTTADCSRNDWNPADVSALGQYLSWYKTLYFPPGVTEGIYTVFANPAAAYCFPSGTCGSNLPQRTDNPYSWIYTSNPAADSSPTWCRGGLELQCNGDTCDIGAAAANLDIISNQNTSGGDCTATLCLVDCSLPQNCGVQTRPQCSGSVDCGLCPTNTPVPTTPPTPTFTPTPTLVPLPDLVVTNLSQTSPGQCVLWDDNFPLPQFRYYYTQFDYTATIRNQGSPAINTPFMNKVEAIPNTVLIVGGSPEDLFTQNSLGGGSQFIRNGQVTFYTVGSPTYDGTIDASVDINNTIYEGPLGSTGESNNTWSNNATRPRFICCPQGYSYDPVFQTCIPPFSTPVPGTPTPTPPIPANSWSFPVQVIEDGDQGAGTSATGINNVSVELLSSNAPWVNPVTCPWTNPSCGAQLATFTPLSGAGSSCVTSTSGGPFNEPGYCHLFSTTYYPWYLVRIQPAGAGNNNGSYVFSSAAFTYNHTTRPPTALNAGAVMSSDSIRRGWWSVPSLGTYAGNVFYAQPPPPTGTPTPTVPASWFQVQGGNALAKNRIRSAVPAGNQFNISTTGEASEGISYYGCTGSCFYGGTTPGKNAQSPAYPELADFDTLYNRFSNVTRINSGPRFYTFWGSNPSGSLGNTAVYLVDNDGNLSTIDGNLTVNGNWSGANTFGSGSTNNGNAVFFVNGNLTINTSNSAGIRVADGAFLGFVVSGNITISNTIGGAEISTTPHIEGFYFADGIFNAGTSQGGTPRINFSGTFAADDFQLDGRDLGPLNQTNPALTFTYRPDFQLSAPQELRRPFRFWQELAP